jgi:hypothetical protein
MEWNGEEVEGKRWRWRRGDGRMDGRKRVVRCCETQE